MLTDTDRALGPLRLFLDDVAKPLAGAQSGTVLSTPPAPELPAAAEPHVGTPAGLGLEGSAGEP